MKRFLVICVVAVVAACGARAADPELKTDDDKTLYSLGLVIANQLGTFKLTAAELEIVKSGITDGVMKKPAKVELETFGPKIRPLNEARLAVGASEERKKGKAFLDTVAGKKGIKKTGTGLLMETLVEGTGKNPAPNDKIKANYKGALIDGHVFDESAKHGGPQEFTVGAPNLMKCWNEALEFTKVGGKYKIYCPADLAYGDRPNGEIPAGATLVFDMELVEIVK